MGSLHLMDAAVIGAVRMPATVRLGANEGRFDLPVWVGDDGSLRIGLPVTDPRHGADLDQVIIPGVADALIALASAVKNAEKNDRGSDTASDSGTTRAGSTADKRIHGT